MAKHTVQAGEILGAIAKKYPGNASLLNIITSAYKIDDPNEIFSGMEREISG